MSDLIKIDAVKNTMTMEDVFSKQIISSFENYDCKEGEPSENESMLVRTKILVEVLAFSKVAL